MSVILWTMDEPRPAASLEEKALEVLRAAVEAARGQPGVHVSRAQVMHQAWVFELEEFLRIAQYLEGRGLIDEGVNQYDLFCVTLSGIAAGSKK
jgi:hypothetical protein